MVHDKLSRRAFTRMVLHDFTNGILYAKVKWALLFFILVVFLTAFVNQVQIVFETSDQVIKPSFVDCLVYLFQGIDIYKMTDGEAFPIPTHLLILNLLLALFIMGYSSKDLSGNGLHFFIRSQKRVYWYSIKIIWVMACVICFYMFILIVITLFCLSFGSLSLSFSSEIGEKVIGFKFKVPLSLRDVAIMLLLPIITSITISVMQLALEMWVGAIGSFCTVVLLFLSSAYYFSHILPGNFFMIRRSETVIPHGITVNEVVIWCLIVVLVSIILGYIGILRKDVVLQQHSEN